ncbi:MAG: hypothetical protein M9944_22205 [Rhizobiaceae bacterium]|nr:hypothetical protein [Rhizobiaceae bacterium]
MADPHDVAFGARLLAIETTLRVLVEHISVSEPGVRDRVRDKLEDYLSGLDQASELESGFIRRTRAFTESILKIRKSSS